jgi:6,7-dimethyl-8-ribityllumazine synthase
MNRSTPQNSLVMGSRIAFVMAAWHGDIVEQSHATFTRYLEDAGFDKGAIDTFHVPGSLEIPLQCKLLAKTGRYQLIVAAGFIVNGGIYRHDFVSTAVLNGIMQVQLETEIPVLSIVLTPQLFNGEQEHHDFFFNHFRAKGREAAEACIVVLSNQMQLHIDKNANGDKGLTAASPS